MKKLNIEIKKAQLVSFSVKLEEEMPEVSATIELMTEGNKTITSYTISSNAWNNDQKFDLPVEAIAPIRDIMDLLERVVVEHCNTNIKALPSGE